MNSFPEQFQSKSEDEILNLAIEANEVTPEAKEALDVELIRRGLSDDEIREVRERREFQEKVRAKRRVSVGLSSAG